MSLCIGETSRSLKQSVEETHAERVLSTKVQGESSMLEISLKYWWCLWKLVWCQHILYGKPGAFCASSVCTDCNLALFLRLFVSLYLNWHEVESELKKSHLNWIKCPCFSEIFSLAHESFFFIVHSDGGSKTECVDGGIGLVIESVDGCLFWEELTSCPFEEGSDSQERHYTCVIVHHLHTLTRTVEFSVTAAHVITHSRCSQDVLAAACIAVTYWFKSNT